MPVRFGIEHELGDVDRAVGLVSEHGVVDEASPEWNQEAVDQSLSAGAKSMSPVQHGQLPAAERGTEEVLRQDLVRHVDGRGDRAGASARQTEQTWHQAAADRSS